MKKVFLGFAIYAVMLVIISVGNDIVLLGLHDWSYYYTLDGIKLAAIVSGVETLIIAVSSKLLFRKFLGDKEFYKYFGEKEES